MEESDGTKISASPCTVASAGMLIEPGTEVRVIEIRGGRLIVCPVEMA